ncbi:MAG: RtcB family protein [Candidatus Woesearchaeota archaeon]
MEPKKVAENTWMIPKTDKMNVPGIVYASDKLMELIKRDKTLQQVSNVACLKGIQRASYAMPDAHQGYGFSIGGVAAFDVENGIISPGGVGYDINCSVRLLSTNIPVDEFLKHREELVNELFKNVPSGVGSKGRLGKVTTDMLREVLANGSQWAVKQGYGKKEDWIKTEDSGNLKGDPHAVSEMAFKRGIPQLGSLGAGNHFLEVQQIDEVYDSKTAKIFGVDNKGNVTIMVHCGSRGLGHQVASDYIKEMEAKYGHEHLPDRELINAPIQSELGQKYLKAMNAAANFAFANKQMITHWIRESVEKVLGNSDVNVVYDICHNIAKIEKHIITPLDDFSGNNRDLMKGTEASSRNAEKKMVCVHRKGATRSFGPDRDELPDCYKATGQPVLIPGSMGTASYVLVGTKKAEQVSFASTAHGAGRIMSRHEALQKFKGEKVKSDLMAKNIFVKSQSWKGIAEESPGVYKDIDEVVRVSHELGIGNLVVKVKPLGVIKG